MTSLLEFREMIKKIYSRNAVFILPVIKFLLAFVTLNLINGKMGYMTKLDNIAIVLIISLMCSFLPGASLILFAALFTLLHMYALSIEVVLVGFCLYLVLFLLFFRFNPRDSLAVVLTPLLFIMKIPCVIPVVMGLVGTPMSAVSVACGIVVYYLLSVVIDSAPTINTMGDEATAKIRLVVDGLLENKAMLVMIAAFAITVVVVYLIRRMAVDYCWTIAMVAGAMMNLVILLVGDLMYDTHISVLASILGSVLAVLVGKIVEFFGFCVDYSRTEKVQFEDDEYYYYVKAIPKMTVAEPTKTVKKINTQQRPSAPANGRTTVRTRSVTTERTGTGAYGSQRRQSSYNGRSNDRVNNSRSVTINSSNLTEDGDSGDFEELF
ncbi:MAG: hypothetical protein NC081_01750 [Roseburia sp.]|nr:hypothetical protein [Roseburia sp.]